MAIDGKNVNSIKASIADLHVVSLHSVHCSSCCNVNHGLLSIGIESRFNDVTTIVASIVTKTILPFVLFRDYSFLTLHSKH